MIAIILQALWELGRKAIKGKLTLAIGIACLVLYFLGIDEVLLLFAGGSTLMLMQNWARLRDVKPSILLPLRFDTASLLNAALPTLTAAPVTFSLSTLFLTFLKIGAILYGSGYVLVAFLRADFVERLGWLTEQQLIDAIAIGQITPGPLFTSATFIGYLLGGVPAALVATLGIFLPSYIFVAISNPIIPKLRQSPWMGSLLDGVIVASLGLMAAVTFQLGLASLIDLTALVIFGLSAILLIRYKVNTTWLILGGALIGFITSLLH
jgi:chromate transporter